MSKSYEATLKITSSFCETNSSCMYLPWTFALFTSVQGKIPDNAGNNLEELEQHLVSWEASQAGKKM